MNNNNFKIEKRKKVIKIVMIQIFIMFLFILLWEISSKKEWIDSFLFSKPSEILKTFILYIKNNEIYRHIYISLLETLLGLIIGTTLGIVFAIILWWNKTTFKIFEPFLIVGNALPKTALAPILIIWAGTGIKGITVVAVSISLVLTIISCYNYFIMVEDEKINMILEAGRYAPTGANSQDVKLSHSV